MCHIRFLHHIIEIIKISEKEKTSHTNSQRHECQMLLTEMNRTSQMTISKWFVVHKSARRYCEAQLPGENRYECIIQILRNAIF